MNYGNHVSLVNIRKYLLSRSRVCKSLISLYCISMVCKHFQCSHALSYQTIMLCPVKGQNYNKPITHVLSGILKRSFYSKQMSLLLSLDAATQACHLEWDPWPSTPATSAFRAAFKIMTVHPLVLWLTKGKENTSGFSCKNTLLYRYSLGIRLLRSSEWVNTGSVSSCATSEMCFCNSVFTTHERVWGIDSILTETNTVPCKLLPQNS